MDRSELELIGAVIRWVFLLGACGIVGVTLSIAGTVFLRAGVKATLKDKRISLGRLFLIAAVSQFAATPLAVHLFGVERWNESTVGTTLALSAAMAIMVFFALLMIGRLQIVEAIRVGGVSFLPVLVLFGIYFLVFINTSQLAEVFKQIARSRL